MARWRIALLLAVVTFGGLLLLVRPPARLGPWGSPLVFAAGFVLFAVAMFRGSRIALAALLVIVAVPGVVVGFAAWYLDRYPGQGALDAEITSIVPAGFGEDTAARQECDGWGCSDHVIRTFTGPGSASAVTDGLAVRMRQACYRDAARPTDGSTSATLKGTCERHDMVLEAWITQQGPDVLLVLGAYPRGTQG